MLGGGGWEGGGCGSTRYLDDPNILKYSYKHEHLLYDYMVKGNVIFFVNVKASYKKETFNNGHLCT